LIAGAHKGEGLGNKFLAHIKAVQAIAHVVKCFGEDADPIADINTIHTELLLADIDFMQKILLKEKKDQSKQKLYNNLINHLNAGNFANSFIGEDISYLSLFTSKPEFLILNVDDVDKRQHLITKVQNSNTCKVCVVTQNNTAILAKISSIAFESLRLISFFTTGEKETRSWPIAIGSFANVAAGKIHTDFISKFIRAQVVSYSDFIFYKSLEKAKAAGKLKLEGKNYIMQDGDVVNFLLRS